MCMVNTSSYPVAEKINQGYDGIDKVGSYSLILEYR
jgi:hypothetical protein